MIGSEVGRYLMAKEFGKELNKLLADGIRFDPHYVPSLNSDHLPMTLCAMTGLGASHEQLLAFRADYCSILRPVASHTRESAIKGDEWRSLIGVSDGYAELLRYLLQTISTKGIDATLREYLPEFIDSLALAAFHPVIRLGFAIEARCQEEVAASLAYLITTHRPVPASIGKVCDLEEQLKVQAGAGKIIEMRSFGSALVDLISQERYPNVSATDFDICARMSLTVYRSTRNFFALHMVTATYAVRVCSKYLDEGRALGALTRALLGAHLVVGSPGFDAVNPAPVPDKLDMPHAYKYLYVCLKEYQHYGDERYLKEITDFCTKGLVPAWVTP
jgi:hypothetical protein